MIATVIPTSVPRERTTSWRPWCPRRLDRLTRRPPRPNQARAQSTYSHHRRNELRTLPDRCLPPSGADVDHHARARRARPVAHRERDLHVAQHHNGRRHTSLAPASGLGGTFRGPVTEGPHVGLDLRRAVGAGSVQPRSRRAPDRIRSTRIGDQVPEPSASSSMRPETARRSRRVGCRSAFLLVCLEPVAPRFILRERRFPGGS